MGGSGVTLSRATVLQLGRDRGQTEMEYLDSHSRVGRRGFIASAGGLLVGGCAHCHFPAPRPPALTGVSDAHAHFFNAADLPVAGFVKFVVIPRYFGSPPAYALAIVDIVSSAAERFTISARGELRQISLFGNLSRGVPSEADFAREAAETHRAALQDDAADKHLTRLGPYAAVKADVGLAESHRALAALFGTEGLNALPSTAPGLSERDFLQMLRPRIQGADVMQASTAVGTLEHSEIGADDDLQCGSTAAGSASLLSLSRQRDSVVTLLRWAWLMCRSRCSHVEEYIATITRPGVEVADAANLLVDYDKWLDDSPKRGSGMADQVEFWTRYADVSRKLPGRIRLHTFAGFDPLRDAEERVLEQRPLNDTTLTAMKGWALAGIDPQSRSPRRIEGFKLYPPMGFRPDANARWTVSNVRGGAAIKSRWGAAREPLIGTEIDRSLNDLLAFCVENDVPVFTHARESNIALPGHELDPSPAHWIARAEQLAVAFPQHPPLRLCIGHFDMFSCSNGPATDADVLRKALELNRRDRSGRRRARIYFDVSFDQRILSGEGEELLGQLASICQEAGDDGGSIMFGSDWIMLANQESADGYLAAAYAAAIRIDFWKLRIDKLFQNNFVAFLTPTARPQF